jgi:hypothetical protein
LVYISNIERVLQTYSLTEILELNELTEEDVVEILLRHEYIEIPNPKPIDLDG